MTIDEKINKLRKELEKNRVDAYIIPSSDAHLSEYVADHFKAREWISGFTGSAGTVVVSKNHAGLWTDSRYFLQAEEELKGSEFILHKVIDRSYPNYLKYIADHFPKGSVIACDGKVFSYGQIINIKKTLDEKGIKLRTDLDLIQELWTDRPSLPQNKIFELDVKYTGKSRKEKFDEVRKIFKETGSSQYLISALDSIAWILNLRGSDIDYNPVFLSFGILRNDDFLLFTEENKVSDELNNILGKDNIKIQPYARIYPYLESLDKNIKIYVNPDTCNYNLFSSISSEIVKGDDIVSDLKTIKNPVEIENLKRAHIIDGIALTKFYIWLENTLQNKSVSEYEAAQKLAYFRSQNEEYVSESFGAIVGYKSNGAIIHYSPDEKKCDQIKPEGMLLIDSGGQYLCGTTDITRTTYFGNPSQEEKRNFTLVLKGHIAVAILKFPDGTNGYQIDTFARQFLWEDGLNYYHGTGHGVGFFLNVHEGPQGISSALANRSKVALKPGMLTSNEPGYYKDGHYGIRIENLILAVENGETEYGKFYKHQTVTMFPLDTKLIDQTILTKSEVQWINDYQNEVYDKLSPYLNDNEKEWLREKCENI